MTFGLVDTAKYLTCKLGDERYGLEIGAVQQIISLATIAAVPRTPAFVRGVISQRGRVIPVIDLGAKLGLPPVADSDRTCIVVVQATLDDTAMTMGIVVDGVGEVVEIPDQHLAPAPAFCSDEAGRFLLGMGTVAGEVILLLDLDGALAW